jgi:hypothetical protein
VLCPESLPPAESSGEVVVVVLLLLSLLSLLLVELSVVGALLVELCDEAAYAATPTASVPATLAAMSAPVIAVVRRSPESRSMSVPLIR